MRHAGLKMELIKQNWFSAGETQIELSYFYYSEDGTHIIDARRFGNDLMSISQMKDILDHIKPNDAKVLNIPYMPYSRQDRRMSSEGYTGSHALKVFSKFINTLEFDRVITFDPHSDVTEALFDNLTIISNHEFVRKSLSDLGMNTKDEHVHIVVPDAGASKKIISLTKSFSWNMKQNLHIHQCEKHRNPTDGKITHTSIPQSLIDLPANTKVHIVDDICDGGTSFIKIAELQPNLEWNLLVSHGIFSKGLEEIFEHFERVFTTDSFSQESHEQLLVFPLDQYNASHNSRT